jgi:hypothetical protein
MLAEFFKALIGLAIAFGFHLNDVQFSQLVIVISLGFTPVGPGQLGAHGQAARDERR